jgi:alpha-beta hydrolase superfamily lysophospholipase
MNRRTQLIIVTITLIVALAGSVGAQGRNGTFVLRSGSDTVVLERFRWEGRTLHSENVIRMAQARIAFDLTLNAERGPERLLNQYRSLADSAGAKPRQEARFTFPGDSVIAEIDNPGRPTTTQRLGSKAGAIPYVNPSTSILEVVLARALAGGQWPAKIPMFATAGGQTFDAEVTRNGSDSVVVVLAGGEMRLAVDGQGRITGGKIPAQGLVIERVNDVAASSFASEVPDYSAPAGAPYLAINVVVPTPMGHNLAGTLTVPKTAGASNKVPAVVTITGSGSQDRDEYLPIVKGYRPFRQIADSLGRRGIAVLRMDDRGNGASGGIGPGSTSADFADDIRAGLAFLRTRPEIDGARLGLVGHSEGGLIAPMVGATDPELKGMVLLAGPSRNGRGILEFQLRNNFSRDTSRSKAARDSMVAGVPAMVDSMAKADAWLRFFLQYEPNETARKMKVPVLILQGATDQQVTADQAPELEQAFKAAGNKDVTMRVFPEMNHLFIHDPSGVPSGYTQLKRTAVEPEVIGALVDWFVKHLIRPAT